jgi:hypothetical protein
MPAEIKAAYDASLNEAKARRFPPIPSWLAAAPVQLACFMPNGDVIIQGSLGAWDADNSKDYWDRAQLMDKTWQRYSASGELLGVLQRDQAPWCAFYGMGMLAQYDAEKAAGHMVFDYRGIWLSVDQASGQLFSAWDWDGTPLPLDQPITRPTAFGSWLLWDDIVGIHRAQFAGRCGKAAVAGPQTIYWLLGLPGDTQAVGLSRDERGG